MDFDGLKRDLAGELYTDETTRKVYATDASAYREIPLAVAIPKDDEDIIRLVDFSRKNKTSLIPRTAGTSLAGQVVGGGIVVDISKNFNKILEVNEKEGWAIVQPGIVRDDLNYQLSRYGYFFAPETSTANRAMIGGMIGNNSCGSNSVVYGSTREHLLEADAILSDGSQVLFSELDKTAYDKKLNDKTLEGSLYAQINRMLSDPKNIKEIEAQYPKSSINRRNTGYAIDMLARMQPFSNKGQNFNFCSLIAGSEGTLAFITKAKIRLTPIPPPHKVLVCIHCHSIDESLKANLVALEHNPSAVELMDHYVFEATKRNRAQAENRFFIEGDPKAILVAELTRASQEEADKEANQLIDHLKNDGLGYSYPTVSGDDIKKVWNLRKAGLGLLSNVPGDAKPVPVIEDTAVHVKDLPAFIAEFNEILKKYGLYSVHYAHAGSGELHLRPIINLKTSDGIGLFRTIAEEIATLVKKYKGSLSGEHGDGRLRGEFIPQMVGEHNYQLLRELKKTWDPENIFNPGKIVDTQPMDTSLRFEKDQEIKEIDTLLDFSDTLGFQRAAEQCNGSADCRKTPITGGTMCPSYMATRNEKDTTRARANVLREMITRSDNGNLLVHDEIKEVMDLCLSCKGCKSECPSNVDIGKMKAEWQHQYYSAKGVPFRNRLIGNFSGGMKLASAIPWGYRLVFNTPLLSDIAKSVMGFALKRSMPEISATTWKKWLRSFKPTAEKPIKTVYLFADEFLNYSEAEIGITTVKLLDRLGYEVKFVNHADSGRSLISKGLLKRAKVLCEQNVALFKDLVTKDSPLVGVEPSAILTFRDEYPDMLRGEEKVAAQQIAEHTFMIEEFLAAELEAGNITPDSFRKEKGLIRLHGHCHQKALSSMVPTKKILNKLTGLEVQLIPSGCCGMAGSFGFEKEHFDVSMQIGELVLFPTIRKQSEEVIIAAPGTSCRHQILDGTGKEAKHPVEILYDVLA